MMEELLHHSLSCLVIKVDQHVTAEHGVEIGAQLPHVPGIRQVPQEKTHRTLRLVPEDKVLPHPVKVPLQVGLRHVLHRPAAVPPPPSPFQDAVVDVHGHHFEGKALFLQHFPQDDGQGVGFFPRGASGGKHPEPPAPPSPAPGDELRQAILGEAL